MTIEVMDQALQIMDRSGASRGVSYLQSKGIHPDLATIALVGVRRAVSEYGVDFSNTNWKTRRPK